MPKQTRPHYFLITGEILFAYKDAPASFQTIRLNAVIQNETQKFPAGMIARGQKAAQMTFFNRIGDAIHEVDVKDVVLTNVSYLGEFEEGEFNKLPPDIQKQYDEQMTAEQAANEALAKAASNDGS